MSAEMLLAWAPGRSAIGNMLLAGALLSRTVLAEKTHSSIGKMLLAWAPLSRTLLAEKPQSSIGKH